LIRSSGLRGGKVLVVDDSSVNRAVLVKYLEIRGFDVVAAEDGSTALARTSSERFAMIFVDLYMPGIDGLATIKRIRAQGCHEDKPIIVCTGETSEQVQLAALNAGATGILVKPIRSSALDEILGRPVSR
jgi:CheY-like chemotaxis protein